jgi:hypothetical protein
MGILCMGPVGWITLALCLEAFGSIKPRRKKVMGYAEWRELTPEQQANPSKPTSTPVLVLVVLTIAILGAAAIGSVSPEPTSRAVTFPLSR